MILKIWLNIVLYLSLAFSEEENTVDYTLHSEAPTSSPENVTITTHVERTLSDAVLYKYGPQNVKSRYLRYPCSFDIQRCRVPFTRIPWEMPYLKYAPTNFESPFLKFMPGADPHITDPNFNPKWNMDAGGVNRKSYTRKYSVLDNHPLNPIGRTGLSGRGVLPKWGPNYEITIVITKWLTANRSSETTLHRNTNMPILQVLGSKFSKEVLWSFPRGFLLSNESVVEGMVRIFLTSFVKQDVLQSRGLNVSWVKETLEGLFSKGQRIYRGYVDDERNTDNAWIECIVMHCHDENYNVFRVFPLVGPLTTTYKWLLINRGLRMVGSQSHFIEIVSIIMNSHW